MGSCAPATWWNEMAKLWRTCGRCGLRLGRETCPCGGTPPQLLEFVTEAAAGPLEEGVPLPPGRPTPPAGWELTRADRKLLRSYGIATS